MARTYLDTASPIAALATRPGRASLAVLRCSGQGAIGLCGDCFKGRRPLSDIRGYSMAHGAFIDPETGERVDEIMAAVFRAPKSFTGEDSVEFYCHGSPAVVNRVLSVLHRQGFSPALPGEFTFRAFIHGKTDLVEAEAVNELTGALCESAREDALRRLTGALSSRLSDIRGRLVDLAAEMEARLDYPDDEGPEVDAGSPFDVESSPNKDPLAARLGDLASALSALSESYVAGRLRQEGALVVLAGRPNAGKSSLFNLIVREERAIVSPEPGTTRDWLEAWVEIGGFAVRLVDTAGIHDAEGGIEAEGVRRSISLVESADIVMYVVDGKTGPGVDDRAFLAKYPESLPLWNKIDAQNCGPTPPGWIGISAKKGDRLTALEASIISRLAASGGKQGTPEDREQEVNIASSRQKILIDQSLTAIGRALADMRLGHPLDIVTLDLREAMDALGEITGEIAGDEIFDRIFSTFCLGK